MHLSFDDLLTVHEVLIADPAAAADLLKRVLHREPPPAAVEALAEFLEPLAEEEFTDVELRVWYLAWTLGEDD